MTTLARPQLAACPGCVASPAALPGAVRAVQDGDVTRALSLPQIHCAACISSAEAALLNVPGVRQARVNLTRRRATVEAAPEVAPETLIAALAAAGHEALELDPGQLSSTEADRAGRDLLMRLAVAGFAAMNVMLLSVAVWSGAEGPTRDLFHWVSAAITLPAIAFSAQPFFRNAWTALRAGRLNMDVPISLAIALAVVTSLWETALSGRHAYFDAAMALTFFLLAGRYLDFRTRAAARSAAAELAALEVPRALRIAPDGKREEVAVSALVVGDLVRVLPGGRMPVDGVVVDGQSALDRSLLTGETLPVPAAPGTTVSAGEVALDGALVLRATAVGRETSLARMADLVAHAESGRARYTPLADRAAKLYAPGVHILAGLAFLGWVLGTGDIRVAVGIAAAVLIITCPCALGLAVPAVTTAASGRLFRKGLLIKDGTALERLAEVDTVIFDKTGTLTTGALRVRDAQDLPAGAAPVALALADASSHPLAKALALWLRDKGVVPAPLDHVTELSGRGIEGRWQGQVVRLGHAAWVGADPTAQADAQTTATWLRIGDAPARAVYFADTARDGAARAVAALRELGCDVTLLSGDVAGAVGDLATRVGINDWQAAMRPEDKARVIATLQAQGRKVLMVGDGLNDTAALAAAHVSISPASALDAARVASDIVLLGQSLAPLGEAMQIARVARRRISQNFRIATWYNVIAVPLAVAGLATPLIAALAMSASSLTVSLNALRLGRPG